MAKPERLDRTLDTILGGNPDAFHLILKEYGPPLRAFLSSQMFQQSDVDDVSQDVFVAAYRNLHTYDRDLDFGNWLRGIARNKLRHYFERMNRSSAKIATFKEKLLPLLHDEFETRAGDTQAQNLQTMLLCVEKLPQRMRQAVRSWLDEGKASALAAELGTSSHAVYQLQYRALQMLRACMLKEVPHER